jgi:peptide/nickel transport system substrate-binding protein
MLLTLLFASCAAPQPGTPTQPSVSSPQSSAPKRITTAILGNPFTLSALINTAGGDTVPGVPEVELLVHAGLALAGGGGLRPQLAEAVPTIENGAWRLLPDGRMEMSWRLRENALWHDGAPVTAHDMAFTLQVLQDGELSAVRNRTYDMIESVDAPDARSILVKWKRLYVAADGWMGGSGERIAMPFPSHLLERQYQADKATFLDLPYWSEAFVGAGPFKLRSWVRESHLVLEANDRYVLGRPRLDEIEVRFIPDPNAMMATILAGAVEVNFGRGFSIEQAVDIASQWRDGRLVTTPARWVVLFPQLLTPSPAVVGDVRFRRALLHAIDRQRMVDTFQKSLSAVAHSILEPNQPKYRAIEQRVTRYEYDTRRAGQIIEELGYTRGADGLVRDSAGLPLIFEARTPNVGPNELLNLAVVDYWKSIGLSPEVVVVPRQRLGDNEYRWTFPGFELTKRPHDARGLGNFHSSQTPLPENRFLGSNVSRYINPEFDALLDRYFTTITEGPRTEVLGEIIQHISDRLIAMGLVYDPEASLVGNRLVNVAGAPTLDALQTWNAEQWDVR